VRPFTRPLSIALAALSLGGCIAQDGSRGRPNPSAEIATAAVPVTPDAGPTIGQGSVKVGLILPLTGPGQGAVAAASLRNAAELALADFQNPDLTILVKDDRGAADGAREAATQVIADGAELIVGRYSRQP
jgi:ABC-type branched-subunit amino acid transport system substrate-binding protein